MAQLLCGARGLRVVDDGGDGCRVEVEEEAGAAEVKEQLEIKDSLEIKELLEQRVIKV